jgi:hypothetical protein
MSELETESDSESFRRFHKWRMDARKSKLERFNIYYEKI